ncbi:MAG TPA: hypothetical protein VM599_10280, partial [Thermoanaerobaculia bacterium]|nr:hypothetical protein [Thermoanaerobaculia bacterium]
MNRPTMPTPTPLLLAATALAAALLAPAARAATIVVTTTDMTIDAGSCTDAANDVTIADLPGDDGVISLPEAICAANGTAGADTIELQAGAVYTISAPHNYWYGPTGLPAISSEIVIEGNGAVIERDAAAPKLRLFYVAGSLHPVFTPPAPGDPLLDPTPGTLTLRNLTLRNGLARGGNAGVDGGAGAGLGGAIYNQGTLLLDGVTATGNVAEGGSSGAASGSGGGGLGGDSDGRGGGGFKDPGGSTDGGGFLGGEGGGGSAPAGGTSAIGGDGGDGGNQSGGGGGGFVDDGGDASGSSGGSG